MYVISRLPRKLYGNHVIFQFCFQDFKRGSQWVHMLLLWNHPCLLGTNVRAFRGLPLSKNLHPTNVDTSISLIFSEFSRTLLPPKLRRGVNLATHEHWPPRIKMI